MASAAAVATAIIIIIAASIVATAVVSAAHHQHHGNISFQLPSTRHGGHRFRHQYYFGSDDPRRIRPNRNDYSNSRTLLRYHLDVDGNNSVDGGTNPANVGRRRWRRNSHYFGSSFDPALQVRDEIRLHIVYVSFHMILSLCSRLVIPPYAMCRKFVNDHYQQPRHFNYIIPNTIIPIMIPLQTRRTIRIHPQEQLSSYNKRYGCFKTNTQLPMRLLE